MKSKKVTFFIRLIRHVLPVCQNLSFSQPPPHPVNKNSSDQQYKHWCCFNLKQNLILETLDWNSLQFCEIEEYSVQFLSTISQFIYNPFLWHVLPLLLNRMHSTRLNKIYSAIHCKTFGNKCPWKWTLKRMPCITEDVAWLAQNPHCSTVSTESNWSTFASLRRQKWGLHVCRPFSRGTRNNKYVTSIQCHNRRH